MFYINYQKGNALFLILLAVALFAALSYAVSSGMRSNGGNADSDNAKSAASAMLQNATSMVTAVDRLRTTNFCKDTEISFENTIDSGYTNNARADGTCKLFSPTGAGLSYPVPDPNWFDSSLSSVAPTFYGKWFFYNSVCVVNVGTGVSATHCWNDGVLTDNDLTVYLPFVKKEICKEINIAAGIPLNNGDAFLSPGGSINFINARKFVGVYEDVGSTNSNWIGQGTLASGANYWGKNFGCYQLETVTNSGVPAGRYVFYMVLLTR